MCPGHARPAGGLSALQSVERNIAGILGLTGFVIACVGGLAAGNEGVSILWKALGAMVFCTLIGLLLGKVARVVAAEHAADHRDRNPIPTPAAPPGAPEPGEAESAQPSHPSQAA